VKVPDGVDARAVTALMLNHYNIEIGNGLGELAGRIWRIGLMGYNSRFDVVTLVVEALQRCIATVRATTAAPAASPSIASSPQTLSSPPRH